jgi:hypothetical protein
MKKLDYNSRNNGRNLEKGAIFNTVQNKKDFRQNLIFNKVTDNLKNDFTNSIIQQEWVSGQKQTISTKVIPNPRQVVQMMERIT